jgi:farnesyl-diphosphate farnesyltransferase
MKPPSETGVFAEPPASQASKPGSEERLDGLLRDTSRSFYLALRVLPASVRPQIGLAYLLARTSDTIADTGVVTVDRRLDLLAQFRGRVLGTSEAPMEAGELEQHQGSAAERRLLKHGETALAKLLDFPAADTQLIREVLTRIISGQELDLRRFAGASATHVHALATAAELDDYTYRVAGCVGEFWTKMCRAHVFPRANLDDSLLLKNGVLFGQGQQLVNILRDLPADLRQGRCYLPEDELKAAGLAPKDLLDPAAESRLRPVYNRWLERAEANLAAGWVYTNALPRKSARVRLACAWPILIGARTLDLLWSGRILDPTRRIKVSRQTVRWLMAKSVLLYPFENAWRGLGGQIDVA